MVEYYISSLPHNMQQAKRGRLRATVWARIARHESFTSLHNDRTSNRLSGDDSGFKSVAKKKNVCEIPMFGIFTGSTCS